MDEKFEERTGEYEEREDHRLKHAGAIALFLLSPVFSYVMFEFVTGNFVMVLPKNAVLNIVWMFALYLLVFGISGSTRISVPVSSVILYAISLAEAFVVSFRSRPIMMGDVLAVKTAMTVAGSYDYTPTFMMIICGVLLIIWNALAQFVFVRVKGKKKRAVVFSVSAGAVAAFIACFYNFMISGLSLEVNLWDPTTSYAENGYILSSAISIKYLVKKAPGGYSQAKIQEICDKYVDSEKERNEQKMVWYETPFVIWTNYDQPSEDMGRLGAIYLSSYVLKRANLSLTPYNEFLLQLSEKLPIIHHLGIWESDGTYHSWEDAESGDYDWKEQLVEYENLVYNHSLDSKTVNEMFSIAP